MNSFRLKSESGAPMRQLFQAFEIEAMKHAVNEGLSEGTDFTFGASCETFRVVENSQYFIEIIREKNGKRLRAVKRFVQDATTEMPGTSAQENQEKTQEQNFEKNSAPEIKETQKSGEMSESKLAIAISAIMQIAGENAKIDYDKIFAYVDERISKSGHAGNTEIRVNSCPAVEIKGRTHSKLNRVLFWAANREPVYLYGPAGTGKNVLAKQLAEGLGLDFYYCGCLQNKYELEGFIDAGGNYQETEFFKAFTQGGVFLFDEIDGTAAEVLVAFNAALSNGYYNFPKHGRINAHENFVCIAAGNTVGRGANDAYNGRFQLDASTLDRFAFVELDYDRQIEISTAGGDEELVDFIHTVREEINKSGLTYTASPRAIRRIAMCMKAGGTFEEGIKEGLTGSWDENDTKRIAARIKDLNKYCTKFKNMYK